MAVQRRMFSLAKQGVKKFGSIMSRPKNIATVGRIGSNAMYIGGVSAMALGQPEIGAPLLMGAKGLDMASQSVSRGRQINKDRRTLR